MDRTKFTASINAARAQAKSLEGKEIKVRVDVDKGKLDATVRSVKDKLTDLDRQKVEPKINIDRSGLATRRISLLKTALIGLAPAGIPILAGLTAATLGLSGAFAAAGAGMGAFGLAAGGAIAQAAEANKEITKLEEQLEDTDDIAKRAEIYGKLDRVWQDMDSHTREFVQTLRGTKTVWDQFLAATRPTTLALASKALGQIGPALAPLPGVVDKFAPVFQSWLSGITNFIRGPGYAGFLSFISQEGPPALENLGRLVVNLGTGVASLVRTFTPFGQEFLYTLTQGSETFRNWARDLGGTGGFQTFMAYIQQTGPMVVEALGSLANAVIQVTQALAPLGGPTLQIITGIADGLAAISDVAPGLIQFALIAGTVARGIGAISDAQIAVGRRTERFKAHFADAVGPVNKFKAGLSGALGLVGGPWGLALAGGTIALGYFASKHVEAQQRVQDLTAALKESSGAIDSNVRSQVTASLEQANALKNAEKLGISMDEVTDAAINQGGSLETLRARLREIVQEHSHVQASGRGAVQVYDEQGRAAQDLLGALSESNSELNKSAASARRQAEANKEVITSQDGVKFATQQAADAYDKQRRAIEKNIAAQQALIDKTREARNQALGYRNAQVGLEQAIDDAAQSLKDNGKTLDINTEKGRNNREALYGIAAAINEVVDSEKFRAASAPGQIKILEDQRSRFVDIAVAMGATKDAAQAMANELIKTPKEITTEHTLKTDEAALEKLKADAAAIPKETTTEAKFVTDDANVAAYLGVLGTIPPEKPTAAKFATDNANVAAYQQALGGIPPSVPTAGQFSGNIPGVEGWKQEIAGIPSSKSTSGQFSADTGSVNSWIGSLGNIPRSITTYVGVSISGANRRLLDQARGATGGIAMPDGTIQHSFARGGVIPGFAPGVDSFPAMLSPGEGILRPEVVRALGVKTIHALNNAAKTMSASTTVSVNPPNRNVRPIVIENYHTNVTRATERESLMDTTQELNLMFGDIR